MSRLDSFIRRMQAQRACLDSATSLIRALPGNVLEFGLGNGRTYDHLRERLPTRDIFVFDRQLAAHPACIPPADRLFLGEVLETLLQAIVRLGANTALANLDIGTGDEQATEELVRHITPLLLRLLKPGAIIVSGRPIEHISLTALSLPYAVKPGRHFMYSRISHENVAALVDLKPVNDNRRQKHQRMLASE